MNPFDNELISVEITNFRSIFLTWEEFEELYYGGFWTEEGLETILELHFKEDNEEDEE